MNYLKALIAEQRDFLSALCVSIVFNFSVTIQHEYLAVALAYRVLLVLFVAIIISMFIQFINQQYNPDHE